MNNYTVYTCNEYSEVEIPLDELIIDGKVDIFQEISESGLFDIDYRRSELRLVSKGFVGLVPLNSRIALRVLPRFPIANVFHLLQKSDRSVKELPNFIRSYQIQDGYYDRIDSIVGENFVNGLFLITQDGISKRYLEKEELGGHRGRVLFAKTFSQAYSRNLRFRQCRQVFSLSEDTPENRLIKKQIVRLRSVLSSTGANWKLLQKIDDLIGKFSRVDSTFISANPSVLLDAIRREKWASPRILSVFWLAYILETKRGLSITSFGNTELSSLLVNMADVFESYIRELVRDHFQNAECSVLDGNIDPFPLFANQNVYMVKPDIYIFLKNGRRLIIDAKYKPKRNAADRYEVLAFCEALSSDCAIIVAPMATSRSQRTRLLGTTPGGVKVHELFIDLGNPNIQCEETDFLESLTNFTL